MNITKPGARIDRPTIRELIAYATCRNHPISNSTLLLHITQNTQKNHFPLSASLKTSFPHRSGASLRSSQSSERL